MIITTSNLKDSILLDNPFADVKILDELCYLVRKYQLAWIPGYRKDSNAFFIASDLSAAKGLDVKDYAKHWSDSVTSSGKGNPLKLAGKEFKLEKEALKNFKLKYQDTYGTSLGKINSLIILDWERAYSYLVQGSTETAKDFQSLGARAVKNQVEAEINKRSHYNTELEMHCNLAYLSSLSNYTLKSEVSVVDYPDSKTKHRRYDLIHQLPHRTKGKLVTIYELKRDIITLDIVKSTLEDKKYLQLAKERFGGEVKFVFVAPWGGNGEALEYVQYKDNVEIQTLKKFSTFLIDKVRDKHAKLDSYFANMLINDNFIVQKLIAEPQEFLDKKALKEAQ